MNLKSHRWQQSAIALAAATLFGLSAPASWALSLGSVVVQSALGEPLRAEIDVPDINAEEAATLKASIASPEAFKAAGLEFNSALSGLKVSLQRRANGRAYIRLTSDKPVSEPFVDMILEASWASGRIVRDYTMLFDPPSLKATAAAVPTQAAVAATSIAPSTSSGAAPSTFAGAASTNARPAPASQRPAAKQPAASDKPAQISDKQVTVRAGDTASKIAMATKPATISLDQMLVALLRSNPNAFINGNINRIKSGAVINVPTGEEAQAMGAAEATQTVIAQSRDFGDFRKKLASNAPTAAMAAPDRKAGGSVQTKVDDKKASATAPDKLTLSKGALKAQVEAERVAKKRAAKEVAGREAEVKKNMADLAKLGASQPKPATSAPGTAPAAASAALSGTAAKAGSAASGTAGLAAPVGAVSAPVAAVAAVTAPVVSYTAPPAIGASAPAATVAAKTAASAAEAPKSKPKAVVVAPPPPEPSLIDQLTENPLIPAAGAGLVALLAGFAFYRSRQRKQAEQEDSAFLESRLQPDSFFGASGGQKVDTNEGGGSSMVYTPSQLDAADDVDPVAEADVYLAYGRDVQAEEILREALKFNPARAAIHHKLLEILAKRRDVAGFATAAAEAHKATAGDGPDWLRVCDLGLSIDPQNTLYMPGGRPMGSMSGPAPLGGSEARGTGLDFGTVGAAAAAAGVAGAAASAIGAGSSAAASSFAAITTPLALQATDTGPVDLSFDLDLDFSLDEENANVIKDIGTAERTSRMAPLNSGPVPLDMNFELPLPSAAVPLSALTTPPVESAAPGMGPIEFSLPNIAPPAIAGMSPGEAEEFKQQAAVSFGNTIAGPLATFAPKVAEPVAPTEGMMEFDLGSLSLDLSETTVSTMAATPAVADDPLATKLSLAEEFSTIGDEDGARALIEEVIAEASGEMRARAQAALAKLN